MQQGGVRTGISDAFALVGGSGAGLTARETGRSRAERERQIKTRDSA